MKEVSVWCHEFTMHAVHDKGFIMLIPPNKWRVNCGGVHSCMGQQQINILVYSFNGWNDSLSAENHVI